MTLLILMPDAGASPPVHLAEHLSGNVGTTGSGSSGTHCTAALSGCPLLCPHNWNTVTQIEKDEGEETVSGF